MPASLKLTAQQLYAETLREFPAALCFILDSDYNLPTHDSLAVWGNWAREKLAGFGITAWKAFFDCDKYSLFFKVMAALMHYAAWCFGRANAQGVAVGVLVYDVAGEITRRHMINIVRTERGIEKYEPQQTRTVDLTPEEKSCATLVIW